MEFHDILKTLRKKKNFTQAELACILEVEQSLVSSWENNSVKPSFENLIKLSRVFEVSLDTLMGVNNTQKKN